MHHECRGQSVIPFYGITKVPEKNKYAMVMRRAKYGDLRKYIKNFPELTWADRIEILINIQIYSRKEFEYESETKTLEYTTNIAPIDFSNIDEPIDLDSKEYSVSQRTYGETALSLRYLTIISQSQEQHEEQSEKAKKYLIDELKDEKLVKSY
ncbi:hypothetical protein C1646_748520 [Rhizophagus diaphanus]|nr:hypothetical protein C1646_748520 [Rhizophagus diaphanus] [Rhizophagus sp. MUCL 43196]